MLQGTSKQQLAGWIRAGVKRLSALLPIATREDSHNVIGLSITSNYIKLLKIKSAENTYQVEYFNIVKLPQGMVVKNEVKDYHAVGAILRNLVDASDLITKNVAITIPRSSAIVKNITVDSRLNQEEVESRVWVEANRLFPNLIGDIYLDFAIVGPSSQDASQSEVLLVACRKEQIKPYLEIMRLAGLNIKIVDINYFALERALGLVSKQFPQFSTIAMMNIGYSLIDLLVMHDGKLIYTHELGYDGNNLKQLSKDDVPTDDQAGIDDAKRLEMLKSILGLHIRHSLQFFYSSRPAVRIEKILLSGDCSAEITGLDKYIQQEVGKDIVLANPFKDMKLAENVDKAKLERYASAMMLCLGVALSKLN